MSRQYHVAIVGATGAVGLEMLDVLDRRCFPVSKLTLLASPRSAGKTFSFKETEIPVEALTPESFAGVDIALFSAGSGISKEFAQHAVNAGAVVVDNSSAFRMDDHVPLVIPEINGADVKHHRGIIANPNCTTAITLMGLYPLHQRFRVRRLFASSYQAVSGAGAQAIAELKNQVVQLGAGEAPTVSAFAHQIAFNVIPQVDSFLDSGYSKEEMKLQNEGRRIMHLPMFRASVTCVRVPVYRAHSVAVSAEFEKPINLTEARRAIETFPGVRITDNPSKSVYPMPLDVAGRDDCEVGRIRLDCAMDNALSFWICGDQLLKGAALNAVQIAELL